MRGDGERQAGRWSLGAAGTPLMGGGSLPAGLASISSNLESILKQRGWEWT